MASNLQEYIAGERCEARAMVFFDLQAYRKRVGEVKTSVAAAPVCAPRQCSAEAIGRVLGPQISMENFKYHERWTWPILNKEVFVEIQQGTERQCF